MSKKLLKGLLGAVLASVAAWGMSLTVMAYEIHPETECDGATYTYVDGEAATQGMIGSEHHYKICSVCGKAFQEHHSNVKFTYVDEHTHSITCGVCGNEWEHTSHENEHVFHSGENKCHFCGWVNPAIKVDAKVKEETEAERKVVEETSPKETQTIGNNIGMYQNELVKSVDSVIGSLPYMDRDTLNICKTYGVTVSTGKWHSFNKKTFAKLEELTKRGVPVNICFDYKGYEFCVTIPAGANVSELCDESGWCGFCNLGSHYGYTLPQNKANQFGDYRTNGFIMFQNVMN